MAALATHGAFEMGRHEARVLQAAALMRGLSSVSEERMMRRYPLVRHRGIRGYALRQKILQNPLFPATTDRHVSFGFINIGELSGDPSRE